MTPQGTTVVEYCRQCPSLPDSWGECPKNRFLRTATGDPGLNYLGAGLKRFFAHATPRSEALAKQIQLDGGGPRPLIV